MNLKNGQTMENKQTAVQWILKELMNDDCLPDGFPFEIYNKALDMEKEQIMNGFNTAIKHQRTMDLHLNAEQYYNETYKQQDND